MKHKIIHTFLILVTAFLSLQEATASALTQWPSDTTGIKIYKQIKQLTYEKETIEEIRDEMEETIDAANENKQTALMYAAYIGDLESIKTIITLGAQVNALDISGRTPFIYALEQGHTSCATYLIEQGANVARAQAKNISPLSAVLIHFLQENSDLFLYDRELALKLLYTFTDSLTLLVENGFVLNSNELKTAKEHITEQILGP